MKLHESLHFETLLTTLYFFLFIKPWNLVAKMMEVLDCKEDIETPSCFCSTNYFARQLGFPLQEMKGFELMSTGGVWSPDVKRNTYWCLKALATIDNIMRMRVNMLTKAVVKPILGSPVNGNSKVVARIVPIMTTFSVSQDKVTRFLNCNWKGAKSILD